MGGRCLLGHTWAGHTRGAYRGVQGGGPIRVLGTGYALGHSERCVRGAPRYLLW